MRKYDLIIIDQQPVMYKVGIYKELALSTNLNFKVLFFNDDVLNKHYDDNFKTFRKSPQECVQGYNFEVCKNILALTKNIKKTNTIIIQTYMGSIYWYILFFAKIYSIKIIFRGEATLKGNEHNSSLKQKLKKIFITNWLKMCDIVMYSCTGNKEYWKYYGVNDNKMLPIPCAVDNSFFQNEYNKYIPQKENIKRELKINKDDFIVLFSARFATIKRPLDLLNSLNKIDTTNITVIFVGDGVERANMENFIKIHNVEAVFVGFISHSEISKYYTIADLNIVISDYDPSPKAMNEAMNFELPIIVTDIVGTSSNLVKENENGFIIKVGDIDTLAKKIDYLNKNREIAKQMGKKSLEIVNEYTFQKDTYFINEAVKRMTSK